MRLSLATKFALAFLGAILLFVSSALVQVRANKAVRLELEIYRNAFAVQESAGRLDRTLRTLISFLGRGRGLELRWTRTQLESLKVHQRLLELGGRLDQLQRAGFFPPELRQEIERIREGLLALGSGQDLAHRLARDPAVRRELAPLPPEVLREDSRAYPAVVRQLLAAQDAEQRGRARVIAVVVRQHLNEVVRALVAFKVRFGRLKHQIEATLAERGQEAVRFTLIANVVALVLALILLVVVLASLRPIRKLIEGVRRVAAGELDAPIPEKRRDEIGALAREFNQMREALKRQRQALVQAERLAAVGKMAAQVAHEIRNPLNAISLNVEMIEEGLASGDPEALVPMMSAVKREVERLTEVTEAYLRYARLPKPRPEEVDFASIARDLVAFQTEEARQRQVAVRLDAPASVPGRADPDQLRQALLNLLRNAFEAAGPGGHVSVSVAEAEGGDVVIEVTDDGPGVPERIREEIFEPFFSEKKHGTGLGLALARRVAETHGGTLTLVDCSEGQLGARFRMVLPRGGR